MKILFQDKDILVVYKEAGLATQTSRIGEKDLVTILKKEMVSQGESSYIGMVHRLDQPVEGILVFGKNKQVTARLSSQLQKEGLGKKYYAVCSCPLDWKPEFDKKVILENYMLQDRTENTSRIVSKKVEGAKRAVLMYHCLEQKVEKSVCLMEIVLETGRHHQIRVQMAGAGLPLLGDLKYGNDSSKRQSQEQNVKNVALCAFSLDFTHPVSGKKLHFHEVPNGTVFQQFQIMGNK